MQVLFPYHAESEVELNLSVGDYIVIRKVCDDLRTLSLSIFLTQIVYFASFYLKNYPSPSFLFFTCYCMYNSIMIFQIVRNLFFRVKDCS
jgi:hypothetical protein